MELDKESERKVDACSKKFIEEHSLQDLQKMHSHAFGVAAKGKDKQRLAHKLAVWTVTGEEPKSAKKNGKNGKNGKNHVEDVMVVDPEILPGAGLAQEETGESQVDESEVEPVFATKEPSITNGSSDQTEETMARSALGRIKGAWDEHEELQEKRKSELAELRQKISKSRDAVAEVLVNDSLDPAKKLSRLEGHWQNLTRAEQKRSDVNTEYRKRIGAAKQTVKTEISNARQLSLF